MFYPYSLPHADVNLSRFQVQAGEERRKGKRKEKRENGEGGKGRIGTEPCPHPHPQPRSAWPEHRPPPLPAVRIPRGAASRGAAQAAARPGRFSRRLLLSVLAGRLRRRRPGPRRDPRARARLRVPIAVHPWSLPPLSRPDPARSLTARRPRCAPHCACTEGHARAPRGAAPPGGRRPPQPGQVSCGPPAGRIGQEGQDGMRTGSAGQGDRDTEGQTAQGKARSWQYAGPRAIDPSVTNPACNLQRCPQPARLQPAVMEELLQKNGNLTHRTMITEY